MRGTVATLKTFERSQRTKNPDSNTSKVDEALLKLVLLSSFCNANEEGELKQKVIRKGGLTQLSWPQYTVTILNVNYYHKCIENLYGIDRASFL